MNKLKEIIERVKEYEDSNCFELKTSVVLHWLNEIQKEAINYTHCCKSDSELLCDSMDIVIEEPISYCKKCCKYSNNPC